MALITWKDILARRQRGRELPFGNVSPHSLSEQKKAFQYYIKKLGSIYRLKPKDKQVANMANLINLNLNSNNGKFVIGPGQGGLNIKDPTLQWKALVKKDPTFSKGFEKYLSRAKTPDLRAIAKKKVPLKNKWESLTTMQQSNARKSFKAFKALEGKLPIKEFAPLTNFSHSYLSQMMHRFDKPIPKVITAKNILEASAITRAQEFKNFFKDNNIKIFKGTKGTGRFPESIKGGDIYFTDPNKTQRAALNGFLNFGTHLRPSKLQRNIVEKYSKNHPLYKDTAQNLRSLLWTAQENLNNTIKGYSNKGLIELMRQKPNILKNATMWFDTSTGKLRYTPLSELSKKGFNFGELRKNLVFEIEHNRAVNDYWKTLSRGEKISAKNRLLIDSEFAHNLTIDTQRYNRGAKEVIVNWLENPANAHKTTEIAALEKELGELGHRFYAGGKWRGRGIDFKPGYRETVFGSWTKALEKSSGFKLSDQLKNVSERNWRAAMKEVTLDPKQLRMLGNFFGCPGTFKGLDEGGRVRLQAGGQGLVQCVDTKLKQPGAMEKVAQLPEEVGGALGKLKNISRGFLGLMGKWGPRVGKYGAIAAAGAVAQPLVKQFRNDDPSTYLTDENQMKGMLESLIEEERPKPRSEILDWGMGAGQLGATAAAIPGSGALYKFRRGLSEAKIPKAGPVSKSGLTAGDYLSKHAGKGYGKLRAGAGVGLKALSGMFTPAGLLATEPLRIAQQRRQGESWGDIATDPFTWMGPAFAPEMTRMATAGMKKGSLLPRLLRLGISRGALAAMGPVGWAGLAASLGWTGYEQYQDYKKGRGFFAED